MPRVGVAVIVLRAHTNRIEDIAPLVPTGAATTLATFLLETHWERGV